MKYNGSDSWYEDDNLLKRRLAYAFLRLRGKIYNNPIRIIGSFLGVIFSKMPIIFSSSLKEKINLTTIMPPESLGIKVVVDRRKDYGRAQFCSKERLTCDWIKKYYNKGDVIYDVEANIGAVSLIAAMYLERDCEIYSFEPLPTTYSMLFKNIMLNNCEKIITPLNIALSNKTKIEQLHLTSIEAGSSGHGVSGNFSNENKIIKTLTVLTQTLDNIINSYHISKPNHIKLTLMDMIMRCY